LHFGASLTLKRGRAHFEGPQAALQGKNCTPLIALTYCPTDIYNFPDRDERRGRENLLDIFIRRRYFLYSNDSTRIEHATKRSIRLSKIERPWCASHRLLSHSSGGTHEFFFAIAQFVDFNAIGSASLWIVV
jgi:hypothetical protein